MTSCTRISQYTDLSPDEERQHTHIEPRSIALHSIQYLLNRTLVHKVPQCLPRGAVDVLGRGLSLKDVFPDGRRGALSRVNDTVCLVERMLAPEKRRVGRGLVEPWRDELCAEGFEDGIEGQGTLRTEGVTFLPHVDK